MNAHVSNNKLHGNQNVFLIGPMGVGKTTIGKLLAKELGLQFIDTDQEVERRAGADISWIFDVEGEAGFRIRETSVLDDLTQEPKVLLATGGGSILKPENRRYLCSRGVVVFLDTTVEMQLKRTEKDKKRPLLQQGNPKEILTRLKAERDPIFQELADIRVNLGESNSRKIVNAIIRKLEQENYIKA